VTRAELDLLRSADFDFDIDTRFVKDMRLFS
jgi:hypothetical protein